jgi:GNAT superfamily N-acetyltransferase
MNDDYTVSIKRFSKLTPKEIRRLKKLTLGRYPGNSAMLPYLLRLEGDIDYARKMTAIMLLNKRGVIVAWSCLRKFRTRLELVRGEVEINVFTAPNYRKLGLGSILVGESKRYVTKTWRRQPIIAFWHDKSSRRFYERNDFYVQHDRGTSGEMIWTKE